MCHLKNLVFFFATLQVTTALWSCSSDEDCSSISGRVCRDGACTCPLGQELVTGGSECAHIAPYYESPCVEDFQCSRLFPGYQCHGNDDSSEKTCRCQQGYHYFYGRCWQSTDLGQPCSTDEQCLNVLRDPYSMRCDEVCSCAEGYQLRQGNECRRFATAVGEGCVLDVDCQFDNGLCDVTTFTCYDGSGTQQTSRCHYNLQEEQSANHQAVLKQHSTECNALLPCPEQYECSSQGVCVCPSGYYAVEDGGICLAELGSPSTEEQCVGLFAVVQDGICRCPNNFYYDDNMRDCVKAVRSLSDACVTDAMCLTFGTASRCGDPTEPWGLRTCECIPEIAVWDQAMAACRLFVGIGETCEVDSDCLAGELEILCLADDAGTRRCSCPDGLEAIDGLCLRIGLALGESCQVSAECTGAANAACSAGECTCAGGYQQIDDYCAPEIGGICQVDSDCVIDNSVCSVGEGAATCQCDGGFVEHGDICWPIQTSYNGTCNLTAQCTPSLGEGASCEDGLCLCTDTNHYRNGQCWPKIGLFGACSRISECYLEDITDRVVCRNGLCQCDFLYPYSEEENSCLSSSSATFGNIILIASALLYTIKCK